MSPLMRDQAPKSVELGRASRSTHGAGGPYFDVVGFLTPPSLTHE